MRKHITILLIFINQKTPHRIEYSINKRTTKYIR